MQLVDVFSARIKSRCGDLRKAAIERRRVVKVDVAADALEYSAAVIEEELEQLAKTAEWVTPEQFALLQQPPVDVQTVRRWIRQGRLAADRNSKPYLIRRSAVVQRRKAG